MSFPSGTRLSPYEIAAPLGAGGMGEVHRARDTSWGRDVAIKAVPATSAGLEAEGIRYAERAVAERDPFRVLGRVLPLWDAARNAPRYEAIVWRVWG